jgi:putative endonuclease
MKDKIFCVYIVTNIHNTVLYTGVTSSLKTRIWQHKNKIEDGFTKKYNCNKLVYYEVFADAVDAIAREKKIKTFLRKKKLTLISSFNNKWEDLYDKI